MEELSVDKKEKKEKKEVPDWGLFNIHIELP